MKPLDDQIANATAYFEGKVKLVAKTQQEMDSLEKQAEEKALILMDQNRDCVAARKRLLELKSQRAREFKPAEEPQAPPQL